MLLVQQVKEQLLFKIQVEDITASVAGAAAAKVNYTAKTKGVVNLTATNTGGLTSTVTNAGTIADALTSTITLGNAVTTKSNDIDVAGTVATLNVSGGIWCG